jgi:predicted DNA-binding transcriptional regulator YafY
MRADRLLMLLMLLQRHDRLTAESLAEELEVSVRTVYRDIDALSAAGIPLYAEHGHGGGYRLLEEYRTGLTGLTQDEVGALLLLTIPEPLAGLEAGQKLKAALAKLRAARTGYASGPGQGPRIHLDWAWWGQGRESEVHLRALYEAVTTDLKIAIGYRLWNHVEIERTVAPYGLAAKGGAWYLVYAAGGPPRMLRIGELNAVRVLEEPFERPADFDLSACWQALCRESEAESRQFHAVLRAAPEALPGLAHFGMVGPGQGVDARGWTLVETRFDAFEAARTAILGLGSAVVVVDPEALRLSVQDFARQVLKVYATEEQ